MTIGEDNLNHRWILKYGDVERYVDYKQSEDVIKDIMNEMIEEHRELQIKKILTNNEID